MGFRSTPTLRFYWSTNKNFHDERMKDVFTIKKLLEF